MKKLFCIFYATLSFLLLHAQHKVQFIVKEKTAIHHDSIYITGTFNNWDSTGNKNYLMRPYGANEKSITLNLSAGPLRYKFTRGSWLSVEKQNYGDEVPDRVTTITRDTIFKDSVERWRDQMFIDKWYALAAQPTDTERVKILSSLAASYAFITDYYNLDSALYYAQTALQLQQKIVASADAKLWSQGGYSTQLINLQEVVATLMHSLGNYPKALELRLENLKLAEKDKDKFTTIWAIASITNDYAAMEDYPHVLSYGRILDSILHTLNTADTRFAEGRWGSARIISTAYYKLGNLDSALPYAIKMTKINGLNWPEARLANAYNLLADIYSAMGEREKAFAYYRSALSKGFDFLGANSNEGIARLFKKEGRLDSALFYARRALVFYQTQKQTIQSWGENTNTYVAEISPFIAELYKDKGQLDSAYKYLNLSVTLKDSLYNIDKIRQFQTLSYNEAGRRQQLEQQSIEAKKQYDNKVKTYGLITIIVGVLIFSFVLYRNNKNKQKANVQLQTQKKELETTLGELKITQSQLIQSEKMASLGELTAGIAHEIQNPLNFVNNFSEVNTELIEEMKSELTAGHYEDAIEIGNSISENEKKINHHGKRADAIVKGMLQHSRSSSGIKESTDINNLADEYLRLAYHGLRAKDKSFNASMKTDFDKNVGKIDVIPQDMGRAILNLITNAFYAVSEKKKQLANGYEPTVSVRTRKLDNMIELTVMDNGNGIPQKVVDKIFQPFFTTKPTGEGTGLGLSLSYDIIKAHGGQIKAETKENEGSKFIINLPA
ncbi:MAG: ATP-binding protein [Ginsengibacter sp.]